MKTITRIVATFSLLFISSSNAETSDYFSTHEQGWHWYQRDVGSDQLEAGHNNKSTEQNSTSTHILQNIPQKPNALEELNKFQKRLEEVKAEAVMNPTPQNVFNYQKMQYEMLEKSHKFAQIWMQNVYKNPGIDYSLESPSSQNARHLYYQQQTEDKKQKISELSREYGLFYFFKRDCRYCDAFAPVVKKFSEKHHWEVLAISEFGEKSEIFKRSVADNGLADTWGVNTYPSLFAVNPKTGHVIPIAHGMISIEEMEDRIIKIIEVEEQQNKELP